MIRSNFSKDVPLAEIETYDYDTMGLNETGINAGRMRLPTRYDISKYYQRNRRNRGSHIAGEYGRWVRKEEKDLIPFSDDFEWKITYSFPMTTRNPVTANGSVYGGRNVTFRRLYLILCEHFNNHQYFIDEYFDTVYPYTIKSVVDHKLAIIKQDLIGLADYMFEEVNALNAEEGLDEVKINKDGTLSLSASRRNRRAYKTLDEYEKFAQAWENNEGVDLARFIKEDIVNCITSGQLPCQIFSPEESTQRKRKEAGLEIEPLFSATEQLINSLQLFVNIGGSGAWQTQSGILV